MSVDGFVGGPNGEIDWIFRSDDPAATSWTLDTLVHAGVHVMGRRTFYDMVSYWPYATNTFAEAMNGIPKVVFSKRPLEPTCETTGALKDALRLNSTNGSKTDAAKIVTSWMNSPVASGDLAIEVSRMKGESGKYILAHGGASFAQSLIKTGLIDEYRLMIHPVVLGQGLPLFSALPKPLDLKLTGLVRFGSGVVGAVYQPS